jgi:cytochrome P450
MTNRLPAGPRWPKAMQTLAWWTRPTALLERCRARYGQRFTLRMLVLEPVVLFTDPHEVREIFTAPPDVVHPGAGARRSLEPLMGSYSLILLDGAEHLEQRKLMLPAFHGEKMMALASLMEQVTEREVSEWPRDEPIELLDRMRKLTLEIILRTVFGLDPGTRLDRVRELITKQLSMHQFINPALQRDFGPFKPWSRFLALRDETEALIFDLIDERRRSGEDRDDILSMLLEARHEDGSPMTNQELRDQLITLLIAGHETSAGQLAWTFERLTRETSAHERLIAEIDAGENDEYLTATVHEILRHRPVFPVTNGRLVKEPVTIGGHTYPPGIMVSAATHLIHHDSAIYPDPYAFRPERFLDEQPGTYTWIPFGGGRRRCLGASFTQVEMKVVLRTVFGQNEVRAATDDAFEPTVRRGFTVTPGRGAMVVLSPRARRPGGAPTDAVAVEAATTAVR